MKSTFFSKTVLSLLLGTILLMAPVLGSMAQDVLRDDDGTGAEEVRQSGDGSGDDRPSDDKTGSKNQVTMTTWLGGKDEVYINLDNSGEPDEEARIDLAKTVTVTNVSFNLTGLQGIHVTQTETYDFSNLGNVSAWKGANDSAAFMKPTDLMGSEIPPAQYQNLEDTDGQKVLLTSSTQTVFQMFMFNVTDTLNVANMEATWTGYARQTPHPFEYVSQLLVWNNLTAAWELLGQESSPLNEDQTYTITTNLTHTYSSMKYFVGGGSVYLMTIAPMGAKETATISTDYIGLDVSWGTEVYPQRPSLDIGNDGNANWTYTGIFQSTIQLDDNVISGLKEGFQSEILKQGYDQGNFTLVLHFNASTAGKLMVSDLRVTYLLNTAPEMITSIPSTYSVYEDSGENANLIDLYDYFQDDKGPNNLRFEYLVLQPHLVEVVPASSRWFGIKPLANAYGVASFSIIAYDNGSDFQSRTPDDQFIQSNEFEVTIHPTNDAPVIGTLNFPTFQVIPDRVVPGRYWVNGSIAGDSGPGGIGGSGARVGGWVNGTLYAEDVDGDTLTISHDISKTNFQISSTSVPTEKNFMGLMTAEISFNPSPGDQAQYNDGRFVNAFHATITVSDNNITSGTPLSTSIELWIPVKPMNNPPSIYLVDSKVLVDEDTWYNTTVDISDKDIDSNDDYPPEWQERLEVWTDIDDVLGTLISFTPEDGADPGEVDPDDLLDKTQWDFDPETGELAILPTNMDVGDHNITFYVIDQASEMATATLWFRVNNVNDPPVAVISYPQTGSAFDSRKIITLSADTSYDADKIHGDILEYNWTSDLDGLLGENRTIETKLSPGVHIITLSVMDSQGATDNTSITVTITKGIDIGEEEEEEEEEENGNGDGTKPSDVDKSDGVTLEEIVIVLVVIFAILIFIILLLLVRLSRVKRVKKKDKKGKDKKKDKKGKDKKKDKKGKDKKKDKKGKDKEGKDNDEPPMIQPMPGNTLLGPK